MVLTRTKSRRKRRHTYETPVGCKGGWTCVGRHEPQRGEDSMWRARINYRYYNPTDGRWTRRDPAEIIKGMNLYSYLMAHIANSLDYLGLKSWWPWSQNSPNIPSVNKPELPLDRYQMETSDDTKCGRLKNQALQTSRVKDYMEEIQRKGCGLPIFVCACCTNKAGGWNVPASKDVEKPHIVLCTNGNQSSTNTPGYLMHELTHFLQVCEGRSNDDCDSIYINEVEANKIQGKDLQRALSDALTSTTMTENCKKMQYHPSQETLDKALMIYNA